MGYPGKYYRWRIDYHITENIGRFNYLDYLEEKALAKGYAYISWLRLLTPISSVQELIFDGYNY